MSSSNSKPPLHPRNRRRARRSRKTRRHAPHDSSPYEPLLDGTQFNRQPNVGALQTFPFCPHCAPIDEGTEADTEPCHYTHPTLRAVPDQHGHHQSASPHLRTLDISRTVSKAHYQSAHSLERPNLLQRLLQALKGCVTTLKP